MPSPSTDAYSPSFLADHSAPRPIIPRWLFTDVMIPFIHTRLLLICAGWVALSHLPTVRAPGWDAPTSSAALNIAFSPLLPMLMKCGGALFGGTPSAQLLAGILLSNLALIAGLIYLALLMRLDGHDPAVASRAIWYLLVFPTTFFLSAVYPMSLFLALSVAAFFHARRRQWPLAGMLTGLAALSRPDGVLLSLALALEYLHQHHFSLRRLRPDALWLALGPLALTGWMACQWRWFGNPLAFIAAQREWAPSPFQTVIHSSRAPLQIGSAALFVLLTVLGFRLLRPSYTLFGVALLGVMLMADRYWSITRFVLVLFPAFMVLAMVGRRYPIIHYIYTLLAAPLAAFLMMRFALNQWVA
jgi:hypothetical protein